MTGVGAEAALVGLGAVHGLNPGMGWLFAVALGLQERSRRARRRWLPPPSNALRSLLGVPVDGVLLRLAQARTGAGAATGTVFHTAGGATPFRSGSCAGSSRLPWWDWVCSAWPGTATRVEGFASAGAISRSGRCSWPPRTGRGSWFCR